MKTHNKEIKELRDAKHDGIYGLEEYQEAVLQNESEGLSRLDRMVLIAQCDGTYGLSGLVIYDQRRGVIYCLPGRGNWVFDWEMQKKQAEYNKNLFLSI